MAIWPFGRKSKRHTIQLGPSETAGIRSPSDTDPGSLPGLEAKLGRKPSRKQSKRRKNRHSQPPEEIPQSFYDAAPSSSHRSQTYPLPATEHEQNSKKSSRNPSLRRDRHLDDRTSHSSAGQDQHSITRAVSLLRRKPSENGPSKLRRKLSKRKAYEIAREQEIRLMSSSPIDIPRRPVTLNGEHHSVETTRGPRARSRRSDRHLSDLSLSIRDSAASSITDISDSYTFKVNAFAAWTPRPVIRYVEAPRPQSRNPSAASTRREKKPVVSISEEDLYSKKRVEELADDLDAGALRELLERDRRRRERKRLEDQEKLQRKLQRRAEKQREEELRLAAHQGQDEDENFAEGERGRPYADTHTASRRAEETIYENDEASQPKGPSGSWLRDPSKDGRRSTRESLESVHVIGNIDDSSIRAKRLSQRHSLLSQSTTSISHSPVRQGMVSPSTSQIYGIARDSTSDVSRAVESERRLSDNSGKRMNSLSSFFRRGSSRLKRSHPQRVQDQASEFSNTSHESFFKVQTHSSGPSLHTTPKTFLRSGTIKRSQSKFTEHFGDEPLSPPDSRLQSPEIPETILDQSSPENDDESFLHVGTESSAPGPETESNEAGASRHRSWAADSFEAGSENVPLSRSLASIDSEGSWMSGQFLRRISQRTNNPLRHSMGSTTNRFEEESREAADFAGDDCFVRFRSSHDEARRASSNAIGTGNDEEGDISQVPEVGGGETWHEEVGRRPVFVNPAAAVRPKSNVGLLSHVQSLSPLSAEVEDTSPVED